MQNQLIPDYLDIQQKKNDQITKKEEDDDDSKRVPHAAKIPIENFRHSSLELEPLIQNYVPATPLQQLFQNPKWVINSKNLLELSNCMQKSFS